MADLSLTYCISYFIMLQLIFTSRLIHIAMATIHCFQSSNRMQHLKKASVSMAKFPPAGNGVNGWGRGVGGCSVFTQNILAVQNVNYKLPLRLGIFKLNC